MDSPAANTEHFSLSDNHRMILATLSLVRGEVPLRSLSDAVVFELAPESGTGRTPHQQLMTDLRYLQHSGLLDVVVPVSRFPMLGGSVHSPNSEDKTIKMTPAGLAFTQEIQAA